MAVFSKQSLITELLDRNELLKANAQLFLRLTNEQLHWTPGADQWSIAGIFQHLQQINEVYIRNILSRITLAPDVREETFNTGWLGDWMCSRIKPRPDGSVVKLKAKKPFSPDCPEHEGRQALQGFLHQCDAIDDILRYVATKDLRRIKIPVSHSRILNLRLGDNLRYLVAHSERHLLEAQRVMALI